MINFDLLEMYGRVAVKCESVEHAEMFCNEMHKRFPSYMTYFKPGDVGWDFRDAFGDFEPVCYAPHIYDKLFPYMQIATERYWKTCGYKVVNFKELLEAEVDLGDIQLSEFSLDELYAIGE